METQLLIRDFPQKLFSFFFILQTTSDFSSKFIIVVIKEAESSLFLESSQHPACYKHAGFHGNLEQALQSKHLSSREKNGWVWRRAAGE